MRSATLMRQPGADYGTLGELESDDGQLVLVSLEPPWRDLDRNGVGDNDLSCVNAGIYRAEYRDHPHLGWCYQLVDVPGRTGICLHLGNFAGDVKLGLVSDVKGCILVGTAKGMLVPNQKKHPGAAPQKAVLHSHDALDALLNWAQREPFMLHIIEPG